MQLEVRMEKRKLGRSGISIAPFVLGGNVFGWTADEGASFAILDAYAGEGFDAIDTADVYSRWVPGHSGGESEAVIGRWLKARGGRDRVTIATKVGMDMGEAGKGLRREHIERAAEASLRRLQTDYIDLYQSHTDDGETPLEETLSAYERLIEAGKVRAIGASNYTADRLAEALSVSGAKGLPRYDTLQPLYNLMERQAFEGALSQVAADNEVAVIPFFGLASGFLTGKYRSEADLAKSARGQRVKGYLDAPGFAVLAALDAVAAELAATPAQVALAWLGRKVTAPIASATSVEQLHEILGAVRLQLSDTAVGRLDRASASPN
jgi:aryl-alcohol dehydrogenase-like predicted oxidoreductase